ncbi:MAG: hypothetical protein RL662_1466 [Bacteroidota bacterium]|jgi:FKBP-type peptidyl-prolyl cis-trans isomerase FklB
MKKILLAVSILASTSIFSVYAQKSTKHPVKTNEGPKAISIKTDTDSLAYAYGVSMTNQGLKSYLSQIGVLGDEATNAKNMPIFIKALKEGLAAGADEKARITGLSIGDQLKQMVENLAKQNNLNDINTTLVSKGIEDVLLGNTLLMDNSDALMARKMDEAQLKVELLKQQENAPKIAVGEKFMAENKIKEGVIVLPSGLQYKVLTKGTGEIPAATERVKVHYKGTLLDGTEFDSSYQRGEPVVLAANQVIAGWSEALQLMPVGSKWILYIPYNLAYGERDTGSIPSYSNLIFEIELLSIEK